MTGFIYELNITLRFNLYSSCICSGTATPTTLFVRAGIKKLNFDFQINHLHLYPKNLIYKVTKCR